MRAADLSGAEAYEMLSAAAEQAVKASDHVTALDLYTRLLKRIDRQEAEARYKAVEAQVAVLSGIARKKTGGPSLDSDAADGETLNLDEDL